MIILKNPDLDVGMLIILYALLWVMDNRWSMLSAVILITLLISCGCTSQAPSPTVPVSPAPGQPGIHGDAIRFAIGILYTQY